MNGPQVQNIQTCQPLGEAHPRNPSCGRTLCNTNAPWQKTHLCQGTLYRLPWGAALNSLCSTLYVVTTTSVQARRVGVKSLQRLGPWYNAVRSCGAFWLTSSIHCCAYIYRKAVSLHAQNLWSMSARHASAQLTIWLSVASMCAFTAMLARRQMGLMVQQRHRQG